MLRNGQAQDRREDVLSPNDLEVLEQSATRLIADLRTAADECVARIEQVLVDAEIRIKAIEASGSAARAVGEERFHPTESPDTNVPAAVAACLQTSAGPAETPAEAARNAGLTTGEVQLIRDLRSLACE